MKALQFTAFPVPKKIKDMLTGLTFCIAFVLFMSLLSGIKVPSIDFLHLLIIAYASYEANKWLGTKIFKKPLPTLPGKIFYKILILYVGVILITSGIMALFGLYHYLAYGNDINRLTSGFFTSVSTDSFIWLPMGLMVGTIIIFYNLWMESLKNEQKLREEKLIFQFQALKEQVNPHFLFNSLNTLSSLISTNPELADKYVNKLAAIYRYVLDKTEEKQVDLNTELQFVKEYFYLRQIRDEEKIKLSVVLPDVSTYKILPLSLQLLVENALKHNSATREKPLVIKIFQEDDCIVVQNNIQKKTAFEKSSGLGLKNLTERMKITIGKEVVILSDGFTFSVKVPLIKSV